MAKENKLFSSFVVCETTRNQLKKMPPEMRLRFYDALFDFGIEGVEPGFEDMEDIIWTPMRDFILLSKQDDEQWHEKQRVSGKQGGAPKGNQNAKKQPVVLEQPPLEKQPVVLEQPPLEQTTSCFETTHNKREENGNGNGNTTKEKEREKVDSSFSLSEELNPAQKDLTARIMGHKKTWNESGASPPCDLITFPPLHVQDMTPVLQSYTDERIGMAIQNYATILNRHDEYELDAKPCSSFINFMIRWVEKFVDEAEPFKRFAKATIPKRWGTPQTPARHKESFD